MDNLPDPPWRVWAIGRGRRRPAWWIYICHTFVTWDYEPDNGTFNWPKWLRPIDHLRNDPEALEIIRRANKKNRHKAKAQQLFPAWHITHATADALLIAEYARRKATGQLVASSEARGASKRKPRAARPTTPNPQ